MSLPPDRAVLVQTLAGDIALDSWARHFTLTLPLSSKVYKCVLRWTSIHPRGSRKTPSRLMLQNRERLCPDRQLCSYRNLTLPHNNNLNAFTGFVTQRLSHACHDDSCCVTNRSTATKPDGQTVSIEHYSLSIKPYLTWDN